MRSGQIAAAPVLGGMKPLMTLVVLLWAAGAEAQEIPAANGDWTVEVVTSGGIMGTGRGNVTVNSDGRLTCSRPGCAPTLPRGRVRQIAALIAAIDEPVWVVAAKSLCSDCFETTMTVRRRDGDIQRSNRTRWDDRQRVPAPVRDLLEAIAGSSTLGVGR